MPLSSAQLMQVPGGPGIVGAVKVGQGITLSPDGSVSVNLGDFCSKVEAGNNCTLTPGSGLGVVTVDLNIPPDPGALLPIGTVMTFYQASAPPRWQATDTGTRLLRITGTGGGTGGSVTWDNAFRSVTYTGTVGISGSISGGTDNVSQTPSGSVSLGGLSLGATSISVAQLPGHTHDYQTRPPANTRANSIASGNISNNTDSATDGAGSGGGHDHSLSGGGSFSGNNMSHSHSVSASLGGSSSFSGGTVDLSVGYISMITCAKVSNPT